MESLQIGLRVVRGPHWEWGDVDGGVVEGHVGTVVAMEEPKDGGRPVVVQWDSGKRCRCRCGVAGKYDLRVLDSAPTGIQHLHVECTWCGEKSVRGILWSCTQCVDYHLCTPCYNADRHSVEHKFNRRDVPASRKRVRVPPRYNCPRFIARGVFPGAEVVRGCDWQWKDQDGGVGSIGKVIKIEGWEGENGRSVAQVKWRDAQVSNVYRMSHKGKVDLKCSTAAAGGVYYPSHLPVLGASQEDDCGLLSAGDSAHVELDPDLFKIAQQDHGGWIDGMAEYIGRLCVVHAIHDNRSSAVVRYSNNRIFQLNLGTLTKVDGFLFKYGQTVRVIDDLAKVHSLQQIGAGWNNDMALCLGQLGQVVHILPNGNVKVIIKGQRWILSPETIVPAPGETPPEYTADNIRLGLDAMLAVRISLDAGIADPEALMIAVALGDVKTVNSALEKHPEMIDVVNAEGKRLMHTAIIEGFKPMVELLLKHKSNLESEDNDGDMPLHVSAFCNNGAAARLLLDAGANVNAENGRGASSITLAASQGHDDVLLVLLSHPEANPNFQDVEGRTPLHRAVQSHHRSTLRILLEAGADHTVLNSKQFTVAHEASGLGNIAATEELLRFHPELINVKKDNGSSPLHVAAANNHYDVVSLLASHPTCNVSILNNIRLTALHIAVHEGHIITVERLVGFGADVNAIAGDGNTPLHLALARSTMSAPTKATPFILKLKEELEETHGKGLLNPNIMVGIFLVVQGADLHIKNLMGLSPGKILPSDVWALVSSYKGRSDSFRGALKELVRPFHNELTKVARSQPKIHTAPASMLSKDMQGTSLKTSQNANEVLSKDIQGISLKTSSSAQKTNEVGRSRESGQVSEAKAAKLVDNLYNNTPPVSRRAPTVEDVLTCCLCEIGADIKLLPCGHVALCHNCVVCGQGAKKCPMIECRKPIDNRVSVCVFCKQDGSLDRFSPCAHSVCLGCKAHHSHCLACQILAD